MARTVPWLDSDALVNSVQKRIAFPINQITFTYLDILSFSNEEMLISAVPQVKMAHQEYYIFKESVPLVNNISRYAIPSRALGMALRDLFWADSQGNYFKMVRIAPEDKAFFQRGVGANQAINKYYLEGNEIVLTPDIVSGATGTLVFSFLIRPNNLVRNDRAATILNYQKAITIVDYTQINQGDYIVIQTGNETPSPVTNEFFAFTSYNQTIVSTTPGNQVTDFVTTADFNVGSGNNFTVIISGTSISNLNGTFLATSTGTNSFSIPVVSTITGSGGSYSIPNQFFIGSDNITTATNLQQSITAYITDGSVLSTNSGTNITNTIYFDISTTFIVSNLNAFSVDNNNLYIEFDQLPTTYTEPDTGVVTPFFMTGSLCDFLQTAFGHRIFNYDVPLTLVPNTANVGYFPVDDMMEFLSNGSGGQKGFIPIKVGDYMCLQYESIIPYLPTELHSALAERTAFRILSALGDQAGMQASQAKIADMDRKQATLISSRVEGSVPKVFNEFSLMRLGKRSAFRKV